MKSNDKNPPSNQEIQQLSDNFLYITGEAQNILDDLIQTEKDIDEKLAYLDKFLGKANDLRDLFGEYNDLLNGLLKDFEQFKGQLEDAKDLAVLLRKVVIEMEKGLHRDYLHKDSFIN